MITRTLRRRSRTTRELEAAAEIETSDTNGSNPTKGPLQPSTPSTSLPG